MLKCLLPPFEEVTSTQKPTLGGPAGLYTMAETTAKLQGFCFFFVCLFLTAGDGISVMLSIATCGDTFPKSMSWFRSISGSRACVGTAHRDEKEEGIPAAPKLLLVVFIG